MMEKDLSQERRPGFSGMGRLATSLYILLGLAAIFPLIALTGCGGSGGTYTIQDGDMWLTIAQRFNTTMDAIFGLNKIQDRIHIYSGMTIKIP